MFTSEVHKNAVLGAISVFSSLIGVGAGYKIAKRELKEHYERIADSEIREAKAFYQKPALATEFDFNEVAVLQDEEMPAVAALGRKALQATIDDEVSIVPKREPEEIPQEIKDMYRTGEPVAYHEMHDRPAEVVTTIFESKTVVTEEIFDYEEETARRAENPGQPYIISDAEFNEKGEDYTAVELTWYEDDQTMADAKDQLVQDVDSIIGLDNLKFGYGSGDPKVVYIFNEPMDTLFYVQHFEGSYAKHVAGIDTDALEHSDKSQRVRRFRQGDDG